MPPTQEERAKVRRESLAAKPGGEIEPFAVNAPAGTVPRRAARPGPPPDDLGRRLRSAWKRHPVNAFFGHRTQIAFYRQFHSIIKAGLGMPTVLSELAAYAPDRSMREALRDTAQELQSGSGLADALARHPALFEDAMVELLLVAEETGRMEPMLARIIDYLEKLQKIRWLSVLPMVYGAYLLVGFIFLGPLLKLGPALAAGATDPGRVYFQGLLLNAFLGLLPLALFLAGPFGLVILHLEETWERVRLGIPLAGRVWRRLYGARLFLTLGAGLGAGIEVSRSLKIAVNATGSAVIRSRLAAAQARISAGGTLVEAVRELGVFDLPALGTIGVGEKTGELVPQLEQLAADEQQSALQGIRLLTIAILALVIGLYLAFILKDVLGTLLGPIWHSTQQLNKEIDNL